MKRMKLMLTFAAAAMMAVSCCPKKEAQKMLVLYYSLTGNTKTVAEEIANRLGADIEEIVCVNPYDTNFQACIQRCIQEREQGVIPDIQPIKSDLSQYDIIFIGYPVWFGTYAPPVDKFLLNEDLSCKKIVPFCTFGSGGLDSSVRDLKAAQPGAKGLDCVEYLFTAMPQPRGNDPKMPPATEMKVYVLAEDGHPPLYSPRWLGSLVTR